MFGLKEKRRMVRNPFMNGYNYPYNQYHVFPNQQFYPNQHFYQNQYHNIPHHQNSGLPNLNHQIQNFVPFQMPYPSQVQKPKTTPNGGVKSILNQFKTKDGVYDVNKMMNTAGQMMSTMNQLNGMVKQVGSLFKSKV